MLVAPPLAAPPVPLLPPLVYDALYSCAWPARHRFPMHKFRDLYQYLTTGDATPPPSAAAAVAASTTNGRARLSQFRRPAPLADEAYLLAHDREYYERFTNGHMSEREMRRIGFPSCSPELIARTKAEVSGTVHTARLALQHGLACNLAGGTHHAFRAHGSGFTILNDLAVSALLLLEEGAVQRVLIVDTDAHQGDGTASILRPSCEAGAAFTLSVHCGDNFPFRKERSSLDVELARGTSDDAYMHALRGALDYVLREAFPQPDLVLYDAGVDPHREDKLGLLALSEDGLYARDRHVLDRMIFAGVPVAGVIGGGYTIDRTDLARRHSTLHRAAMDAAAAAAARVSPIASGRAAAPAAAAAAAAAAAEAGAEAEMTDTSRN